VYAQSERLGIPVVTIPGTKRRKWLEQNVAALDVRLDAESLAELEPLGERVVGGRYSNWTPTGPAGGDRAQ
jgi:aryl-alcohol dehydrogenase-like predicted oxidoreductase